ncbi:MAG: hypothetical protein K5663_08235 [Clostridiales bacterium]|nr:hypothetical protein [Clostridiales bacterium]
MITEKEIWEAAKLFLRNPYWKRYYDDAPSEYSKRYVLLSFFWSETRDETKVDEAIKQAKELEKHFSIADCRHALRYCGNNPKVVYWRERIKELTEREGKDNEEPI